MDQAEFEASIAKVQRELKRCRTIPEIRELWQRWYPGIGHRALGRLLVGWTVDELVARRKSTRE